MDISQSKKTIENLLLKSKANTGVYNANSTLHDFVQPFFESLGWNFKSDVIDYLDDDAADKEFQIDGITKFFLKIIPRGTSIESSREQIESLTTLAYNRGITWAIATNFQEMRVYNTEASGNTLKSMEHYSFTENQYISKFDDYLLDLTPHQFSRNILDSNAEWLGSKPIRIPIDKQLLKDLLSFRNLLVINILKNNSIKNEDAERAAQKILNRLIFIRSCGDRQIEQRHLKSSLSDWEKNKNKNKTLMVHLQDIFQHFNDVYGSTLFQKHPCDSLIISDRILQDVINGLYQSKEKAVKYDFAHIEHDSLGKMYENYLGTVQQKKDGAYYTPSYISKYICETTIIPYLSKSNATTIPDLISEYENNLDELESKILDIKILDPACGTGEFLIRAIDILLEISKQIQRKKELQGKYRTVDSTSRKSPRSLKKKKSDLTTLQTFDKDIENQQLRTIIQNNIHGVDINEEAIEITQLNLFLKLSTSSQQLIDLSKNILIGNALVDDPSVDSKAFDWESEFGELLDPKIRDSGFDIIVGNPPYIRVQYLEHEHIDWFKKNKETAIGKIDASGMFFELGKKFLKKNGIMSYITSNQFQVADYGKKTRPFLLREFRILEIIDFGDKQPFENATTYVSIYRLQNTAPQNFKYLEVTNNDLEKFFDKKKFVEIDIEKLSSEPWVLGSDKALKLIEKIKSNHKKIGEIGNASTGLITGKDGILKLKNDKIKNEGLELDCLLPTLVSKDVKRYMPVKPTTHVIYPYLIENDKNILILESELKKYPNIFKYLSKNKSNLIKRKDSRELFPKEKWFGLVRPGQLNNFKKEKIITPGESKEHKFTLDKTGSGFFFARVSSILIDDPNYDLKYVLGVMNTKVIRFFLQKTAPKKENGFFSYTNKFLNDVPIPISTEKIRKSIENDVTDILKLNLDIENTKKEVLKNIEINYKFTIKKEKNILKIQESIKKIEENMEKEVYKLYDITDEEKKIIESSI
jgi:hypothetical protein